MGLIQWFESLLLTGYLFLVRLSVAALLWQPAAVLLAASLAHGLLGRAVGQNNFDYVSPVRQKGALLLMAGLLYALALAFVVPIVLSPYAIASVMLASGMMAGVVLRHIQKRA